MLFSIYLLDRTPQFLKQPRINLIWINFRWKHTHLSGQKLIKDYSSNLHNNISVSAAINEYCVVFIMERTYSKLFLFLDTAHCAWLTAPMITDKTKKTVSGHGCYLARILWKLHGLTGQKTLDRSNCESRLVAALICSLIPLTRVSWVESPAKPLTL